MNTIPLTPVDYIFTGPGSQPITFAFEFPGKIETELLKNSLFETLKVFPPISSKLANTGDNEYAYQECEDGIEFDIAKYEISLSDTYNLHEFITPVQSMVGQPLTNIRITQSSVKTILCVSISHALVDGFSYFHFLSTWARIARGEKFLPPVLTRDLVRGDGNNISKEINPEFFAESTGVYIGPERYDVDQRTMQKDHLLLSKEEIQDLLQEAFQPDRPKLTANDVISAYLWKRYATKWFSDGEVFISCPFDFRGILPDVPRTYFGCAILCASTAIDVNSLKSADIAEVATMIRNAINGMNPEKLALGLDVMESLRLTQGIQALERVHVRHPSKGLIVTNLSRMPLRDVDFGIGPPVKFMAYSDVNHGAAILPAIDGVEVMIYE
ncbi:acyltransferase [Bacteroidota bacterium]